MSKRPSITSLEILNNSSPKDGCTHLVCQCYFVLSASKPTSRLLLIVGLWYWQEAGEPKSEEPLFSCLQEKEKNVYGSPSFCICLSLHFSSHLYPVMIWASEAPKAVRTCFSPLFLKNWWRRCICSWLYSTRLSAWHGRALFVCVCRCTSTSAAPYRLLNKNRGCDPVRTFIIILRATNPTADTWKVKWMSKAFSRQ